MSSWEVFLFAVGFFAGHTVCYLHAIKTIRRLREKAKGSTVRKDQGGSTGEQPE